MANVSPGIYVREFDFSEYAQQLGSTVLAVIGGATKGALNTPTLVTSESDLVRMFGPPVVNDYGLQSAIQFLKTGTQVLFVRVADSDPVLGVKTADAKVFGGVRANGTVSFSVKPGDGDTISVSPGNPVATFVRNSLGSQYNVPILVSGGSAASMIVTGLSGGTATVNASGTLRFADSTNPIDGTKFIVPGSTETVFEIDGNSAFGAHCSILFSAQPADADTVVLNDGVNTAITFEFDSNNSVVQSSILKRVVIGATLAETLANLIASINAATGGSFTISAASLLADRVDIFDSSSTGTEVVTKFDVNSVMTLSAFTNNTQVVRGVSAAATLTALLAAITTAAINVTVTDVSAAKVFEFDNNSSVTGSNIAVALGNGTVSYFTVMQRLIDAFNANLVFGDMTIVASNTSTSLPSAALLAAEPGDQYNSTITVVQTGSPIAVTGMSGGLDDGAQELVTFQAISPGTWANTVSAQIVEYRDPGASLSSPTFKRSLQVFASIDPGVTPALVEVFPDINLDPASDRFLETVLAKGIPGQLPKSDYLSADVYPAGSTNTVPHGVLQVGTYALGRSDLGYTPGQDGITGLRGTSGYSFYVGTVNGSTATGMQALRNPETTEFNILTVPGVSHRSVVQAGLTLCTNRGDALFIIDPPLGLNVNDVIKWHNGLLNPANGGDSSDAPGAAIDSSYGAMFWPWLEVDDPYTKKTLWLPPSGFVAGAMSSVDDAQGPWWTVAGFVRGKLSANRSEYSPTQEDRDNLVGGNNRVNPIVNFQGRGLTIFGNRTLQRRPTALVSLHIRRMLLHAEKVCATAVQVLLFNPNDEQTWREFTALCTTELARIQAGRGIAQFKVICNSTTNTPNLIQNKTMRGKLLVIPVDASEIIQLDFSIYATGSTFDESRL